jgi:transcriptional regulator with XRE-family HTH domain
MISINLITPQEMLKKIAESARTRRLALNLSQQTLSEKSGVSYGVLKKFERTGQISLESLLKLALALGSLNDFESLFAPDKPEEVISLDELMQTAKRKRGRK